MTKQGTLLALLGGVFFTASTLVNRVALRDINPLQAAFFQDVPALLIILGFFLLTKKIKPNKKVLKYGIAAGIILAVLRMSLLGAIKYGGVGISLTLLNLSGILGPILGVYILKETITKKHGLLLIAGFSGAAIITLAQNQAPLEPTWMIGIALGLFVAILSAIETNIEKLGINKYKDATFLSIIVIASSTLTMLPVSLSQSLLSLDQLIPFFVSGTLIGLGFLSMMKAFTTMPLNKVTPILFATQPILGTIGAALLLQEIVSPLTNLGILIASAAIFGLITIKTQH
ncbi:MAG: DMT family transporter [Candidatus Diapherotrites archaeon]|nr:DMT family transporter [Candidatus Diapherotrites archaeon]